MPRPYAVPAKPDLALHVQAPAEMIDAMAAHVPGAPGARSLVSQTIGRFGPFETALATHVDLGRPWDAAWVQDQLIVQIPIAPGSAGQVQQLLSDKAPVGKFGAVDLGRGTAPGPKLAWFDADTTMLTLADDERGLATGRDVATALAGDPAFFATTAAQARKYGAAVAFERLELSGTGTDSLDLHIDGVSPEQLAQLDFLRDGALTGLLESAQIAAGVSSRYANYDREVKSLLAQGKRAVDGAPFFVKGNAEDLLRRSGAVLRSWNGRVMVGVGPERHLLLGLGTEDPKKTEGAFYHLMNGVMSNLSLAKSVGVGVPKLRWKKDKAVAAGQQISVIALEQARKYVPAEYQTLLNEAGELRVAFAFAPRTGAMMIAAGPGCVAVMDTWLVQSKGATSASDSQADFVAATMAVDATTVRTVLQQGLLQPSNLLTLDAGRAPTKVVVRRKDAAFDIALRGPKLTGQPPASSPSRTAARPATKPAARPAAPTRTSKSFGRTGTRKPIQ
jgi:hypothetical protein